MNTTTDDMKSCIQEWFAQACSFEELREIFYVVRCEADKQFVYMSNELAKDEEK